MPYTAGDFLVRAVMTNDTGLPADAVINDFAFEAVNNTLPNSTIDAAFNYVDRFYRTATAGGGAVGEYISTSISRSVTHQLQAFKIQAPSLGSPILEDDWLGPPPALASDNLPNEVAGVLSFHASLTGIQEELGSTRPKARRRGRIYIGPLIAGAISGSGPNPTLFSGFTSTLRQAAVRLMDEAQADGVVTWRVWSRADQTTRPVVGGWTDDAPDTQRRRGQAPNARVVWS